MAQEDFIFTDKTQYKPANVEVGYSPVQAGDVTPLMEKNRDILSDNFRRHQEAEEKNIERENEAAKLADDANVQRLSEFSDKLVGLIQTGIDKRVKHETAELEIWALNNKDELLKSYRDRAENERLALSGQKLANDLSAEAEQQGADTEVIKKLRELGGWRKVAVMRTLLQKAGLDYATYRSSAEVKEIKLARLDKSKPKVNGKYPPLLDKEGNPIFYNIISAGDNGDTAEKAAIITEIKKTYAGKYAGMGTLADRHELMYSKMEEHEESIRAANALEAQERDKKEQKEGINNQLLMSANHSVAQFGKTLQELTTLHGGGGSVRGTFGSVPQAAENFIIAFNKAVTDGLIPPDRAAEILENVRIKDPSKKGEMVSLANHALFGPLIAQTDIEATIQARRAKDHEKFTIKLQNDAKDLKKEMITVDIPKIIKEKGHITRGDLLALEAAWIKDPRGGGAGQPWPLADFGTIQDQDDQAAKILGDHFKEENGGEYITELQASRLPMHIAKQYRDAGLVRDDITPNNTQISKSSEVALQVATDHFNLTNPGALTSDQGNYVRRAEAGYLKEFARLSPIVGVDKAHEMALEYIQKNSKKWAIKPPVGSSSAYVQKTYDVGAAIKTNTKNGVTDFTVKVEGLETEIEQLREIAKLGDGKLPDIFFNVTRDYKMPRGSKNMNAAWAFAAAQYKAYTGEDLFMPNGVTMRTPSGEKLDTSQNTNLNHKNTNSKTNRVIIETGNNEGVVEGSEESGDVSTMTQDTIFGIIEGPYKDQPYANYFQKTEPPDKESWKLDDVLFNKEDDPSLRTSGQYGLSAKQIRDYAKYKGLDLKTTEFNVKLEREIFLHNLDNKLKNNNNNYAGLVKRFPALGTLTEKQVLRLKGLRPSVYHDPNKLYNGLWTM